MKIHPISSKPYGKWWVLIVILSTIIFLAFGTPNYSGPQYGIIFWILGSLLTSLIYGSIIYLVYRLIAGKWNNNAFMICIGIGYVAFLILGYLF